MNNITMFTRYLTTGFLLRICSIMFKYKDVEKGSDLEFLFQRN